MIKNLASYKVGNNYWFVIKDQKLQAKLVAKANKRLQLDIDGKIKWHRSKDLSLGASMKLEPVVEKVAEKPVAKPVPEVKTPMIFQETHKIAPLQAHSNRYWEVHYAKFLKEVRISLREHGYPEAFGSNPAELLKLIDQALDEVKNGS